MGNLVSAGSGNRLEEPLIDDGDNADRAAVDVAVDRNEQSLADQLAQLERSQASLRSSLDRAGSGNNPNPSPYVPAFAQPQPPALQGGAIPQNAAAAAAAAAAESSPYPQLTGAELRSLTSNGLSVDLCFVPYQMSRLTSKLDTAHYAHQRNIKPARVLNSLHVHKHSVSITPLPPPYNSADCQLAFTFDALCPTRIIVHFCAVEHVDRTQPSAAKQYTFTTPPSYPPYVRLYERGGPSLHFLLPVDHPFPSSQLTDIQLMQSTLMSYYPMIIVMENMTVTDEITAEEAVLKSRNRSSRRRTANTVAAADAMQMSSVTSYCSCFRRSDGTIGVKVLKQRIIVGARSYVLNEVYGLTDRNANASGNANSAVGGARQPHSVENVDCVVCLTNARTTAILPCRHLCLCRDCARILQQQTNRCPVCRCLVEATIDIDPPQRNQQHSAVTARS